MDKLSADDPIRAALARDDPAAVEMIWKQHAGDLLAFLQATLCAKHDAEDVLQTVFVKIVRKRRRLVRARRLDAYIFQIARNEAFVFLRQRQRRRTTGPGDEPWLLGTKANDTQDELAERLQAALTGLPREQREVVVLKIYRDKTFQEIGRLLGVSQNTVASRYRYGLEKLRVLLKDHML